MVRERSKPCCETRAKAMFWVSGPITCSTFWGEGQPLGGTAAALAHASEQTRRGLSSGEGTKGPRWHDWAYLELADLEASE